MTVTEIYPFFGKVQSSLLNILDELNDEELNRNILLYDTSVFACFTRLLAFYDKWFFAPLSCADSLSIDPSIASAEQLSVILTDTFKRLDTCLSVDSNLEVLCSINYFRGSVEVEGKFTVAYLLWAVVEQTIHIRAEIVILLKTMNLNHPLILGELTS